MKKVLFFLFLAGMLSSCSDDPDNSAFPEPAIDPASEYAVSPESALDNLELFLGTLQSISGETRAGLFGRRVASILPLKTVSARTRSASASGVENLLYLVAFEDGQGSAILGADTRVNPVYAVLDETVLTPEDFESKNFDLRDSTGHAGDGDEEIRIKDFLVKIILDDVSDNLDRPADPLPGNGGGIDIGGGDWGDPTPAPKYRTAIINKTTQAPLLETKWDQWAPYNDQCDWNSTHTRRCPAGCTNIAVGQILTYNQSGAAISIAGDSFSWSLINECKYGSYPSAGARSEVARFIHTLGVWMGTTYSDLASNTYVSKVSGVLNQSGLRNANLITYTKNAGKNMVCTKKAPFFIHGVHAPNVTSGHHWVIDGWNEYTKQSWMTTYGPNNQVNPEVLLSEEYYCLVHCNFGWDGKCDGYYWYDLFDTTKRLDSDKIDTGAGDYAGSNGSADYKFAYNFKMVVYDK